MNRKDLIIDSLLLILVLGLGIIIFLEWDTLVLSLRGKGLSSVPDDNQRTVLEIETPEPTLTPVRIVDQPSQNPPTDFQLENLDGETISLSDFRGTPVLVNFWATWCPPCRAEMPLIQSYSDQYYPDLIVLAVNVGEDEATVRGFVEEFQLNLIVLLDREEKVVNQYLIRGYPTSLFIDHRGVIQAMHIGELDNTLLAGYLREIGVGE